MTQLKRGQPSQDIFITNMQQKIPGHSDSFKFLWNGHHVKSTDVRKKLTRSVLLKKRKYGT